MINASGPSWPRNGISAANYIDWTKQSKSFESMAARTGSSMSYSGGGDPKPARVWMVSAPYFDVYGAKAAIGVFSSLSILRTFPHLKVSFSQNHSPV